VLTKSREANLAFGILQALDLFSVVDQIKEFEKWAVENYGIKKIEIFGRPGWKKMLAPLGFTFSHVQMDKFIGGVH